MAKKILEKEVDIDAIDMSEQEPVSVSRTEQYEDVDARVRNKSTNKEDLVSCLRNEKIIVRPVLREDGIITNPKHDLYGGMANAAVKYYSVPKLEGSGNYVNVLTKSEKAFLEAYMGLENNALSIYIKKDNYWDNLYVRLTKGDNMFDLSSPDDYIKYKVLLANKDIICDSLNTMQLTPKRTYKFIIVRENEDIEQSNKKLSVNMQAYMKLGELKKNLKLLKMVCETVDGRPISKLDENIVMAIAEKCISTNAKLFVAVCNDPMLETKMLVKDAISARLITKKGEFLYLREDNSPLCGDNEEPNIAAACRYLNLPKNQTLLLSLQAKLK